MFTFNPKLQFLEQEKTAKDFRAIVESQPFQSALLYSLAQFSLSTRSQEQLIGANAFIQILTDIGRTVVEPAEFPDKTKQIHHP